MWGQHNGRTRSRAILKALAGIEAPEIVAGIGDVPIVIRKATGARVRDADGNRYIDLTSFFGVAAVGHRNRAVVQAIRTQAGRLLHAMGDVHPADAKAVFLRELRAWLPAGDYRAVLSLNGSDAVETALKFAGAATGRPGVIAFEGSYHGLSAGALEVTAQRVFRDPFGTTLSGRASFVPFPGAERADGDEVLARVRRLARRRRDPPGAVIVEPIQGRGGIRVPPSRFLRSLADLAREEGLVLIADEVYTGVGRTGAFLACDHEGVVPDVVCLGKALGGGVPLSVCLMKPWVAEAVRAAGGEAPHTSTFLGHPLGCAAGTAVLRELRRGDLCARARRIGDVLLGRGREWAARFSFIQDVRGVGAMVGIELSASPVAREVTRLALERGVILLTEGEAGQVLAFTPPLGISDADLRAALDIVESCLRDAPGSGAG